MKLLVAITGMIAHGHGDVRYAHYGLDIYQPYIQYFGRLEASQNNIVHFDMKKSISVQGILVEYVGSSCSENVLSIKMRVPLIDYSEM